MPRPVRGEMFIVLVQPNTPSPFGGANTEMDKSQPARPLLRTEQVATGSTNDGVHGDCKLEKSRDVIYRKSVPSLLLPVLYRSPAESLNDLRAGAFRIAKSQA